MRYLIFGLRGAGKTTIGELLAQAIARHDSTRTPLFLDSDLEIEAKTGQTAGSWIRNEGEAAFREVESRVLEELALRGEGVLSLGGGAPLKPENRKLFEYWEHRIYLDANNLTLVGRLERSRSDRPALTDAPTLLEEIQTLREARHSVYLNFATHVVDTSDKSPAQVVEEILGVRG